ncbi:hypothetical protein INT45_005398 [Circinella minor]|uniref:Tc1-like transposase DDE domain-containing protein n=1 Tax=Circinella minor TaxID=1195481 RepID=A0A8H7RUC1_9FUNG|nr:hypothetical protein INT45_005398 [Circinella minor]
MWQPYARSTNGIPEIVETPMTHAISSHTILGAISANDVIATEIREPKKSKILKVHSNNTPIHTSYDVIRKIEARGYRVLYIPSYSSELSLIKKFWPILKGAVNEVCSKKLRT